MNYLLMLCGLALLGGAPAQNMVDENGNRTTITVDLHDDCEKDSNFDLNEIVYIEEEPEIDLGFDTSEYLPKDFDAHKLYVNLDAIEYMEEDQEVILGFNTKEYLPANFNPFADPSGIEGINFIEDESNLELGFDTAEYLPENFDPYVRVTELKTAVTL